MDKEGARVLAKAICEKAAAADSIECADLKRKLTACKDDLARTSKKVAKLESLLEDTHKPCPVCDNPITLGEHDELRGCDQCDNKEGCETWEEEHDDPADKMYICEDCDNCVCGDCCSTCDHCGLAFCDA